jgi:hypothetical protein
MLRLRLEDVAKLMVIVAWSVMSESCILSGAVL